MIKQENEKLAHKPDHWHGSSPWVQSQGNQSDDSHHFPVSVPASLHHCQTDTPRLIRFNFRKLMIKYSLNTHKYSLALTKN